MADSAADTMSCLLTKTDVDVREVSQEEQRSTEDILEYPLNQLDQFSQFSQFGQLVFQQEEQEGAASLEQLTGLTASTPPQALPYEEEASILRMCLQDCPDGLTVRSNTGYPYDLKYEASLYDGSVWWQSLPIVGAAPTPAVYSPASAASNRSECAQPLHLNCPTCLRRFANKNSLRKHERSIHGPRVWHVCHVCGKSLASRSTLQTHLFLHSNVNRFHCADCGAGFKRRALLRTHMDIKHTSVSKVDVIRSDAGVGQKTSFRVVHHQTGVDGGGIVLVQTELDVTALASLLSGPASSSSSPTSASSTSPSASSPVYPLDLSLSPSSPPASASSPPSSDPIVLRLVRGSVPGTWRVANLSLLKKVESPACC